MTLPVWVEQRNGRFTASVAGDPRLQADGTTKEEAVLALKMAIDEYRDRGELVLVNMHGFTAAELAARPPLSEEEEEAWREIVDEIYRERDAQKAREFPE
jgi:hypothetical protein